MAAIPSPAKVIHAGSGVKVVLTGTVVAVGFDAVCCSVAVAVVTVVAVSAGAVSEGMTVGVVVKASAMNVTFLSPLVTVPIAPVPV